MSKRLVHMTEDELKDLIYFHCRAATNQLYKGLSNHHFKNIELDMATIISELDFIRNYVQGLPEQKVSVKGEVEKPKKNISKLAEEDAGFAEEAPKKKKTPRRKIKEVSAFELQEAMRNNQITQGV